MNDTIERFADGTLAFLPERLNRDPAVLRGLTNDEMWVALGTGAVIGLLLGVPLAIATSSIAVAPTSMIASMALVVFAGGTLLRRAKRARPETWLYRKLEWILASRWRLGRGSLILHSGAWTIRRSRRLRPALSQWQQPDHDQQPPQLGRAAAAERGINLQSDRRVSGCRRANRPTEKPAAQPAAAFQLTENRPRHGPQEKA